MRFRVRSDERTTLVFPLEPDLRLASGSLALFAEANATGSEYAVLLSRMMEGRPKATRLERRPKAEPPINA